MDKKAKKSEYNRKFRELQKIKGEIKTTEPKVKEKVKVKVEVKPEVKPNFFFQTLKNKMMETMILALIPIGLKTIQILASRISLTTQSQLLQPTLQAKENQSFNIISTETNF